MKIKPMGCFDKDSKSEIKSEIIPHLKTDKIVGSDAVPGVSPGSLRIQQQSSTLSPLIPPSLHTPILANIKGR
jgi:hypothetical protein